MAKGQSEDRYFQERDAEMRSALREQLEAKANAMANKEKMATSVGVTDEQVVAEIEALGFDADTAPVLHLMPLVAVAWADGEVQDEERVVILKAAGSHGIEPGTPAGNMLASLLEKRPADVVLQQVLSVLQHMLAAKGMQPDSVLKACEDVAGACGGFFGFGSKISGDEAEVIEKISASFSGTGTQKVTDQLK
jgi:hypothetical protein